MKFLPFFQVEKEFLKTVAGTIIDLKVKGTFEALVKKLELLESNLIKYKKNMFKIPI